MAGIRFTVRILRLLDFFRPFCFPSHLHLSNQLLSMSFKSLYTFHCSPLIPTKNPPPPEPLPPTGETNKLAVFIYNPDSEYNDAIDLKHGCVRRGWVKVLEMMRRLGVFDRTCSSAEENDASAASGDTGTSEMQRQCKQGSLISPDVMYGLSKAVDWVVASCQGFISGLVDVGKMR